MLGRPKESAGLQKTARFISLRKPLWYRCDMPTATTPTLDRILEPVGRALNPEAARTLAELRLDAKTQARIDRLARKCNEGNLTPKEQSEYEAYVSAIDFVGILQAKARAFLARSTTA
jgi:hypothetical protein